MRLVCLFSLQYLAACRAPSTESSTQRCAFCTFAPSPPFPARLGIWPLLFPHVVGHHICFICLLLCMVFGVLVSRLLYVVYLVSRLSSVISCFLHPVPVPVPPISVPVPLSLSLSTCGTGGMRFFLRTILHSLVPSCPSPPHAPLLADCGWGDDKV
jgi:hypothetical protein